MIVYFEFFYILHSTMFAFKHVTVRIDVFTTLTVSKFCRTSVALKLPCTRNAVKVEAFREPFRASEIKKRVVVPDE